MFQNISLNVYLEIRLALKTCLLLIKIADTSRNDVCFYLYSCILFTFPTVHCCVSLSYEHSETDALKIEFIDGFLCIPVDLCQASVSTKYIYKYPSTEKVQDT